MKGDFTRDTFDATRQFSRVLMQQGRVQLDADFNEQAAILLHYLQTLAADVIGLHGAPAAAAGFGVITDIAQYAQEHDATLSEADKERLAQLSRELRKDAFDFLLTKGRYYADGVLCENLSYTLYSAQASYEAEQVKKLQAPFLLYLDVWERPVTHIEDDRLREVALGGADTAARAKIEWQVRFWAPRDGETPPTDVTPEAIRDGWQKWIDFFQPANRGLLVASLKDAGEAAPEPCITRPDARYRGVENQLYRVEIHQSGKANEATFKWSRENGAVTFPIQRLNGKTVQLESLGRDAVFGLKKDDWVEILDDHHARRNQSGVLAQVGDIEPLDFVVTLKVADATSLPTYEEGSLLHPYLRRWDHQGDTKSLRDGALPVTESDNRPLPLEDNLQILFRPGGEYRAGDYWLIPARVATGDIEWAKQPAAADRKDGATMVSAALPPRGVEHRYAPLALVSSTEATRRLVEDGTEEKKTRRTKATAGKEAIQDCRLIFSPLVALTEK